MSDKKDVKVKISGEDGTKPAFDSAEKHAKGFGASVKHIVEGIGLAKLFEKAAEKVTEFFHGIAEEGMAAERTQKQLANTLANVGIKYADVASQVEEAISKTARASGQADDEVAGALNNMVLKSGDYAKSLAALPLVADVAAGAQISLAEASDVVGKALAGQTKGLKQFGITTKDAHAGLDQLAKRFHGAAATDMTTFSGAMRAAQNATKEAQEELGLAVIQTPFFQQGVRGMTEGITHFAEWLEKNRAEIGYWASVTVSAVKVVGLGVWDLSKALGAAMAWVVSEVLLQTANVTNGINTIIAEGYAKMGMYSKAAETLASNTSTDALEKAVADTKAAGDAATASMQKRWEDHVALVQAGAAKTAETTGTVTGKIAGAATEEAAKAAAERAKKVMEEAKQASEKFLAEMKKAHPDWDWGFGTTDVLDRKRPGEMTAAERAAHDAQVRDAQGKRPEQTEDEKRLGLPADIGPIKVDLPTFRAPMQSLKDDMKDLGDLAKGEFKDAFANAFEAIGSGSEKTGASVLKAGKKMLGGLVKAEGDQMQVKAAEALWDAVHYKDPSQLVAAAGYEAGAALAYTVAGALGGGGGGSRGSRGGGGGAQIVDDIGTARVGSQPAAGALAAPRAQNVFNIIGPNDGQAQRAIVDLLDNAAGRGIKPRG